MECAVFLWKMINFAVFLMDIIYIRYGRKRNVYGYCHHVSKYHLCHCLLSSYGISLAAFSMVRTIVTNIETIVMAV